MLKAKSGLCFTFCSPSSCRFQDLHTLLPLSSSPYLAISDLQMPVLPFSATEKFGRCSFFCTGTTGFFFPFITFEASNSHLKTHVFKKYPVQSAASPGSHNHCYQWESFKKYALQLWQNERDSDKLTLSKTVCPHGISNRWEGVL